MATINTIQTVALIHEAQHMLVTLPKDQRPPLQQHIDSVLSVAAIYLRIPNPEIKPEQAQCVQGLINEMKRLKDTP